MILHAENPKESPKSPKILLELKYFSKVLRYEIKEAILFLYNYNKQHENKIKETITFTIETNRKIFGKTIKLIRKQWHNYL